MAHAHQLTLDSNETRTIASIRGKLMMGGVVVGVVGLVLAIIIAMMGGDGESVHGHTVGGGRRFMLGYIVGFAYFLSISLGALVFVLLQHLTRAGWSSTIRRVAELMAANCCLLAILFLPILFVVLFTDGMIYHWNDPHHVAGDVVLEGKQGYLNKPFFTIRWIFYFVFWIGVSRWYLGQSRLQDQTGNVELTSAMQVRSAPFVFVFALSLTFAAFDLLMSLDAHWFSTMFGVYFFAGGFLNFFAMILLIFFVLQSKGIATKSVTVENIHDLAKFMFAFVFFWGYIAFSQYMLIWYANLPEETLWFARRGAAETDLYAVGTPGWGGIALALLFFHFLIPFPCLFSRWTKRIGKLRMFFVVWLLVMHYVDLAWVVMPEMQEANVGITYSLLTALFATIGIGGLWIANLARIAGEESIIPVQDPRTHEALAYDNF